MTLCENDRRLGAAVIATIKSAAEGMTSDGWAALLDEVESVLRKAGAFRVVHSGKRALAAQEAM